MLTLLLTAVALMLFAAIVLPTVKVEADESFPGRDYVIINEADFDPKKHRIYDPNRPNPPVPAGREAAGKEREPKPPDATDAARKLAEEAGIDLGAVKGSGKDGAITKPDVEAAIEAQKDAGKPRE